MKKTLKTRIEEINKLSALVDQFYCDFGSTVESCLYDLEITYNDRFVWVKADGDRRINERYTLSDEFQVEDLKFMLTQLRKSIKKEVNNLSTCYHCDEPIKEGRSFDSPVGGQECCAACFDQKTADLKDEPTTYYY